MSKSKFFIFFIVLYIVSPISAEEDDHHHDEHHEFEEHTSHVHGHASANVSYEGDVLNVALSFSSTDIFGFEHKPKTEEQHKKIEQSAFILEHANNLFLFNKPNACKLNSVNINSEIIDHDTNVHHVHEAHDHDDTHSDVNAKYLFNCSDNELESIEYLIFDHFPTLEKIEVQFISNEHQVIFNASNDNRIQSIK